MVINVLVVEVWSRYRCRCRVDKIIDVEENIIAVAVLPLWSFQPGIALLCDSQS